MAPKKKLLDRDLIIRLYVDEKKSLNEVEHETGFHAETVRQRLLDWGIPTRSHSEAASGRLHYSWKEIGHKTIDCNGYVLLKIGEDEWVSEHIYVIEQSIGRKIAKGEVVHHIDGVRTDNRLENLELTTISKHVKSHRLDVTGKWARHHDCCASCGDSSRRYGGNGLCSRCWLQHNRKAKQLASIANGQQKGIPSSDY